MRVHRLLVVLLILGLAALVRMVDAHHGAGRVVELVIAPHAAAVRSVRGGQGRQVWSLMRSCFPRDSLPFLGYTGL
jgi:hypothetical protein